jgi:hypothetical protein
MTTKLEKKDLFSGKPEGLTWEKFDDKVISWGRKKFGNAYSIALWKDEMLDLKNLNLEDDLEKAAFDDHCDTVYDMLIHETPKYASDMAKDGRFKTIRWHQDHRQRQREKLFCYLEEITDGEVKRQLKKRGVHQMNTMRSYFFNRFGHGSPDVLMERQRTFLLGMPNSSGEVFPLRVNMEEKLNSLEEEREFLLDMCPVDKRQDYVPGKITTLVRLILENLPAEYDSAVKSVRDLHRLRKYGETGDVKHITNREENERVNYEDAWLPPYDELRVELINTWRLRERRRKEEGKSYKKGNPGHPTLPILPGHDQPGPDQRRCYGCGLFGHTRGDAKCKAGADAIWKGAPQVWRDRMGKRNPGQKRKFAPPKGKGKGKGDGGSPYLRNKGNRNDDGDKEKGICFNWSRGNGFCKYANACRYKHEGPKGGEKKPVPSLVTAKQRKKLSSLIVKDIKSSLKDDEEGEEVHEPRQGKRAKLNMKTAEDHVYRLISGVPSVIITRDDGCEDEWEGGEFCRQIGDRKSLVPATEEETNFIVTLMIKGSSDDDEDYVAVRPPIKEFGSQGRATGEAKRKSADDKGSGSSVTKEGEEEIPLPPPIAKMIDRNLSSDVRTISSEKSILEKDENNNMEVELSVIDYYEDKIGSSSEELGNQTFVSLESAIAHSNVVVRLATEMLSSVEMHHANALPFLSLKRTSVEMKGKQASSSGETEDKQRPEPKAPASVEMRYGKRILGEGAPSREMGGKKGVQFGDKRWAEFNLNEIKGILSPEEDEWYALAKQMGDVIPLKKGEKDRAAMGMLQSWTQKVKDEWKRHVDNCEKEFEESYEKLERLKRKVEESLDGIDRVINEKRGTVAEPLKEKEQRAGYRAGTSKPKVGSESNPKVKEMLHAYVCIVNKASAYVSFIHDGTDSTVG